MDEPPYGDVTARPIYARREHAGTGDDAVYVSWHTNGYDGTARGTETYAHSGESLPRTQGSITLCHTIHTEVVHDIRAGWDSLWTDRGEKTRNLGELRLLWDSDPDTRMPGALIEIAFHDNPADAAALKEPAFQLLAARAVYQGIVKYFKSGIRVRQLTHR
jgi:N-acetylmuramoyl-L-alanine amidase